VKDVIHETLCPAVAKVPIRRRTSPPLEAAPTHSTHSGSAS
jgi:hypothetical protein